MRASVERHGGKVRFGGLNTRIFKEVGEKLNITGFPWVSCFYQVLTQRASLRCARLLHKRARIVRADARRARGSRRRTWPVWAGPTPSSTGPTRRFRTTAPRASPRQHRRRPRRQQRRLRVRGSAPSLHPYHPCPYSLSPFLSCRFSGIASLSS